MLIEHIHGSQVVRFAQGGVSVNVGWSGRLRSRLSGQVIEKQKTRNPLTEVNRPCPPVNQGRGDGLGWWWSILGTYNYLYWVKAYYLTENQALRQVAGKGKSPLVDQFFSSSANQISLIQTYFRKSLGTIRQWESLLTQD